MRIPCYLMRYFLFSSLEKFTKNRFPFEKEWAQLQ